MVIEKYDSKNNQTETRFLVCTVIQLYGMYFDSQKLTFQPQNARRRTNNYGIQAVYIFGYI